MTIMQAARQYSVSRQAITTRLNKAFPAGFRKAGTNELTQEAEDHLAAAYATS